MEMLPIIVEMQEVEKFPNLRSRITTPVSPSRHNGVWG